MYTCRNNYKSWIYAVELNPNLEWVVHSGTVLVLALPGHWSFALRDKRETQKQKQKQDFLYQLIKARADPQRH